jgi:uncharacterized RDD family membrane protein YckC
MLDFDHIEPTSRFAGFASRAIAFVIDVFLFLAAAVLIRVTFQALFAVVDRMIPFIDLQAIASEIDFGLVAGTGLIQLLYFVLFWAAVGQTPGMGLLGIKIVRPNGKPPSFWRSLARYFGYILSLICLGLGFIWILFDAKRQGWFDKIAGTYVVYSREARLYHLQRAKSMTQIQNATEEPLATATAKTSSR